MRKNRTMNMTTGNPSLLLVAFAVPMLIGNIFQQAYNLVDSIVVGKFVGASALAAVGATGSVSFLFFSISGGIGAGCGIVTSQYFGAGAVHKIKQSIANSAYVMFATALIMGLAAFLLAPAVLTLMDTPADIMPDAVLYLRISCVGVPLVAVYNFVSSMLRALGDSRTPLYFLIFASFLNIVFDVVFVYFFGLGVSGVAIATIIAQVIAGIGCLAYTLKTNSYFRISGEERRISGEIVFRSVRLGLPLAMQWSMIALSSAALQSFVNSYGTVAVAAFTATSRIEQLVHQPYGSLSTALSTYSGQNFGAKRIDRVKSGLRHGMFLSAIFTVIMIAGIQIFADDIMSIFVDDRDIIALGAEGLRLTTWFYIFLATINMTRGLLNGVGDALFAFINGIVEVISRSGLPLLIVLIPGMGLMGIWWTAGLSWVISAVFCIVRYLMWRRKVL